MTLFLAALFHSFFVGLVALYSRQINRRWDIFEDDEMCRYTGLLALLFKFSRSKWHIQCPILKDFGRMAGLIIGNDENESVVDSCGISSVNI